MTDWDTGLSVSNQSNDALHIFVTQRLFICSSLGLYTEG